MVVTIVGIIGALLVMFVVGVVAMREDGAVLRPAERDRADLGLPPGPMEPADLERVRFGLALRGYRMDEVDAVMDRLGRELSEAHRRIRQLEGTDEVLDAEVLDAGGVDAGGVEVEGSAEVDT